MGQVLHGSATTTEAVRRAIQHSQESLRVLAKRYAKWYRNCLRHLAGSRGGAVTAPTEPVKLPLNNRTGGSC